MTITFQVAEGNDDFYAIASLWPEKFGSLENNLSAQRLVANAQRAGAAILARTADGIPIAATVLDFDTYDNALFVPFILLGDSGSRRALTQRHMLDFILRAFEASGKKRLLFVTDDSKDHRGAVLDFNELGAKAHLPAELRIIGKANDLFGDGRNVIFHELFIKSRERPHVAANAIAAEEKGVVASGPPASEGDDMVTEPDGGSGSTPSGGTLARISQGAGIGAQVLGDRLMASACCSGCSEKSGKDKDGGGKEGKESGKDGKEGKEGKEGGKEGKDKDGIERVLPTGKLNVESSGAFEFYARLGVKRFNRYANEKFTPLV